MLQLARRETLRVHVGEFLQLQGTFESHGETDVPSQEQHRPRIGHAPAQLPHLVHSGQHGGDGSRHGLQLRELACYLVRVLRAARLGEGEPHQVVRRHLREERLRGGDTDLRTGVRVEHRVGLPRDLRAIGVADREHPRLLLPGVPHGLQRVRRLTGL